MPRQNFNAGGFGHTSYLNGPNNAGRGAGGFNSRSGPSDRPYNQAPGGPSGPMGGSFNAQRPPVGDFSRGMSGGSGDGRQQGSMLGGHSGNSFFGANSGGPLDPSVLEQKAIETARYEFELLEAKKLRKRTMTNEDLPGDQASGGRSSFDHTHQQGSILSRDNYRDNYLGSGAGGASGFGGGRYNNNFGRSREDAPQDSRWGGPQRQEEFGHSGPMGGNHGSFGPNDSGSGQRVPYRTRGPSFDNTSSDQFNRGGGGFGGGGGGFQGGHQGSMNQPYLGLPASAEPTWERMKRAEPPALHTRPQTQGGPAPAFPPNNPFAPPDNAFVNMGANSDRWAQRQSLPPPPALHMNTHFMNVNASSLGANNTNNFGGAGVHPRERGPERERGSEAARGPERERGPRSGNTPRDKSGPDGEGDARWAGNNAQQQNQQNRNVATSVGPSTNADRRSNSNASPSVAAYDPSKPFASLFGKNGGDAGYAAEVAESSISKVDYPLPHEVDAGANQRQAARPQYAAQEQPARAPVHEQEHRPYPSNEGPGRQKMLFDPQSNAFRTLANSEKEKPAYATAKPTKRTTDYEARKSGPPAVEHADAAAVVTAKKPLQVNRIEQNTGEKWTRQPLTKEPTPAAAADIEASRVKGTPQGVRQTDTQHAAADDGEENDNHDADSRLEYLAARKALRDQERADRGPRTKGYLFRHTEDGQIERVYTPEEKIHADEIKLRKERVAGKAKRSYDDDKADSAPAVRAVAHAPTSAPTEDDFDYDKVLTAEEYRALPKERKAEIRARHLENKAARRSVAIAAHNARTHGEEPESLAFNSITLAYSAAGSSGKGSEDLDIQKVARDAEARRNSQPVKTFVPRSETVGEASQDWRKGSSTVSAPRASQDARGEVHSAGRDFHQGITQPTPATVDKSW